MSITKFGLFYGIGENEWFGPPSFDLLDAIEPFDFKYYLDFCIVFDCSILSAFIFISNLSSSSMSYFLELLEGIFETTIDGLDSRLS